MGIIDPVSGTISYASAGHPPAFVRRPGGVIERLAGCGLPIGLRGEVPPEALSIAVLEDDALLVLYTDGVTEAGRDIDAGEARLARALAKLVASFSPAETLRRGVLGGESVEPRDDVAILTVHLTPARHRPLTDLRSGVRDGNSLRHVCRVVVAALRPLLVDGRH